MMPAHLIPDKHFYRQPEELPAGFLEIVQPLASWMMRELVTAYDNGYSAGRMDADYIAAKREMRDIKVPRKNS